MKLTMKQKNQIAIRIIADTIRRYYFKPVTYKQIVKFCDKGGFTFRKFVKLLGMDKKIDMKKLEREAWDAINILSIAGASRKDMIQIIDLVMEKGKYYP
jgi:hypothetical protein